MTSRVRIAASSPEREARIAQPRRLALRWGWLMRMVSGHHLLAWADQAAVSAASFVSLILIARWSGAQQLGAFAIGSSVIALLIAAQESLITRPYSIQLHEPAGTAAEHAFGALTLSLALGAMASFALSATAIMLSAFAHEELAAVAWALAASMPFLLFREFARRFGFAHLKVAQALALDLAVAVLNVAALAWLGLRGQLSAATAIGAMGVTCAIGAIGWLYLAREQFSLRLAEVRTTLKRSWNLGRWLLSGQLAIQAQGYTTYWLLTAVAGLVATGIYTACNSIIAFANPVLFGFYNILTPRSVRTLKQEGVRGLRRQAVRDAVLLAAIMGVFCLFVLLMGERLMHLLYPGAEYQGHGHLLSLLALSALAACVGVPASIGLASAERGGAVALVMTASAVLNVALVWWFLSVWGLLGAAYAILIAESLGSVGRWTAFLALLPQAAATEGRSAAATPNRTSPPPALERAS